jgi:hypothetical protein
MDEFTDYSDSIKSYTFVSLPPPNIKLSFGGSTGTSYFWHSKNIPNRFQRWMLLKVFGVKVEKIEEKNT